MPVYQLPEDDYVFPDPNDAEEDGLIAIGGDLNPERIAIAYINGIFPWFNPEDPILWWSPNPRTILYPNQFQISKSLNRVLKSGKFIVKFDTNFTSVIEKCSKTIRKEETDTWISDEIISAYTQFHNLGLAHSVETYFEGNLVGGLYGISIGKAFFGESMFSIMPDASKIALLKLCEWLTFKEFHFIDCQMHTQHLISLGAVDISREKYLEILEKALNQKTINGNWGDL